MTDIVIAEHGVFSLSRDNFLKLVKLRNTYALRELERLNAFYKKLPECIYEFAIPRNDPDLIALVRNMKSKELTVVTIPDDVEWVIEEDSEFGCEWISEKHRTWP